MYDVLDVGSGGQRLAQKAAVELSDDVQRGIRTKPQRLGANLEGSPAAIG